MKTILFSVTLASLAAVLGATPAGAGALSPPDAHAVIERMAARNPSIKSYQARVHVDIRLLSFPFLAPKLDGTSYFKRPDLYVVVFDRMPTYARSFGRLFNDVGNPLAWERDQNITLDGTTVLGGREMLVLRLTKKIHSDILDHTLAYVDALSYTLTQMEWYYTERRHDYHVGTVPARRQLLGARATARNDPHALRAGAGRRRLRHVSNQRSHRNPRSASAMIETRKIPENVRSASPEETRERILTAAREVIGRKGKRGATTREIADVAGVNEATIFRHFGTKKRSWLRARSISPGTCCWLTSPPVSPEIFRDDLLALARLMFARFEALGDMIRWSLVEQEYEKDIFAETAWRPRARDLSDFDGVHGAPHRGRRTPWRGRKARADVLGLGFHARAGAQKVSRLSTSPRRARGRTSILHRRFSQWGKELVMDTREVDQKTVPGQKTNGPGSVADEPRSGPRRRIIFAVVAVVVIVIAVIWGVPWLTYSLSHEGTDDAHVAADEVAVTSKIPERINRILVDTNQPVRRGQLLNGPRQQRRTCKTSRGAGAVRSRGCQSAFD